MKLEPAPTPPQSLPVCLAPTQGQAHRWGAIPATARLTPTHPRQVSGSLLLSLPPSSSSQAARPPPTTPSTQSRCLQKREGGRHSWRVGVAAGPGTWGRGLRRATPPPHLLWSVFPAHSRRLGIPLSHFRGRRCSPGGNCKCHCTLWAAAPLSPRRAGVWPARPHPAPHPVPRSLDRPRCSGASCKPGCACCAGPVTRPVRPARVAARPCARLPCAARGQARGRRIPRRPGVCP